MDIKTFKSIASKLPPHISVLMRGGTGIGKSAIVAQISENIKLPLIDVRGSTMSEGDTGGYPDIEGMKKNGVMTFCMPAWFVRACNEPVVLFLDELNRSLPAVQQSFFQIVLDRQLGNDESGNPYNIHPETRIFAAVNHGSEYDVNEMDPALLRRFWTVDLEASFEDWEIWAKGENVSDFIISFLKTRKSHFAPDSSEIQPGSVFPTPASWSRLDESIKFLGMDLEDKSNKNISTLFSLSQGFIGKETSIEFSDYVKKYKVYVKPEELLESYEECKERIKKLSNDSINSLIERLGEHAGLNDWTLSQGENVAKLTEDISDEMIVHLWSCISKSKNLKSIQNFHYYVGTKLVEVINSNKDLTN